MAFATKANLKTALAAWMKRASISTSADDCITLAEAGFNRVLGEILTSTTLTGTVSSREISVTSVAEPIALFLAETGLKEVELTKKMDGTFEYSVTSDRPCIWAFNAAASKIYFDCPLSGAYPFRFKHRQRFSLAADGDTNWLLTDHPDLYLAASIVWGALFTDDDGKAGKWNTVLTNGIKEVKAYISAQNRSELTVDPALVGGRSYFDFTSGE